MFWLVLVTLIICLSCLAAFYMWLCYDSGTYMFEDPRYDERIKELEKCILNLNKRIKDLEEK